MEGNVISITGHEDGNMTSLTFFSHEGKWSQNHADKKKKYEKIFTAWK